ncbi:MAG TPA: Hsp70 family protein, partial [Candidatus Binatia bacterium]|nr:Hsp70 family protein [Candidatus Binatia bacterium]
MGYTLGVDLGTTYTAAATDSSGRSDMVSLSDHATAMPSVVVLKADGSVLTGDAADRRAVLEPDRVAREFKRRLGDPTPLILGGSPQSAQALMAHTLRSVVQKAQELQGRAPDQIVLSHPANWGPYKRELFGQVGRIAGLDEVRTVTEPEAAAVHYALTEHVDPGALVAVYDLGGGTFDAAVLRRTEGGFEILGHPEGVERLGGIDFDEAVFAHVARSLGGRLEGMDPGDSAAMAAVARLRQDCVAAKEALSSDTEATIPVMLPGYQSEVRLTRDEFEAMIANPIGDTIAALRRALQSAEVEPGQLSAVLLVGGS